MLYIRSLWLTYFITASLYLLVSHTYFIHPVPYLPYLPFGNHHFVLCIYVYFCFVIFVLFFWFVFLGSTYKWNHITFTFLYLTYFT